MSMRKDEILRIDFLRAIDDILPSHPLFLRVRYFCKRNLNVRDAMSRIQLRIE